jgi:hypothetical protein
MTTRRKINPQRAAMWRVVARVTGATLAVARRANRVAVLANRAALDRELAARTGMDPTVLGRVGSAQFGQRRTIGDR